MKPPTAWAQYEAEDPSWHVLGVSYEKPPIFALRTYGVIIVGRAATCTSIFQHFMPSDHVENNLSPGSSLWPAHKLWKQAGTF